MMRQVASAKKGMATQNIVKVGLFGALAAILMVFEFSLPFVPPFIKMDFSELPVILGGFLMGPLYGFYIALMKILLNFLFNGTTTMGVGELVNLIGSLAYLLPAVLYYRSHRTKSGAIQGLTLAVLVTTIVLLTLNFFVMFPLYAKLMNFPLEAIIQAAGAVNPLVKNLPTLMICSLLPFNLFKYGLTSVLSFFLYKRLERIFQ